MDKKIVATIEARMGSNRLPGKTMMKILEKPMLELMIERLKRSKLIDEIVVATTVEPRDDRIVELAQNLGVQYFRGSEDNVLDRVIKAAESVEADIVVRTTGDCPLIDPEITDVVIKKYLNCDYSYVCNLNHPLNNSNLISGFPNGVDTEVFALSALQQSRELDTSSYNQEHVTPSFYRHWLYCYCVKAPPELHYPRDLSVDTKEDFELIKIIFENLYSKNPEFRLHNVIKFLKEKGL